MFRKSLLLLAILAVSVISEAKVKLPAIIGSNMVIQRNTEAPLWGWADPGEKIKISASWGAEAEAVANKDGKWETKIKTPEAGGPFTITIQASNKIELKDVLSGDIWICSGQSNMAWRVQNTNSAKTEIPKADNPKIRLFKVANVPSIKPLDDTRGSWAVCTPKTVPSFSAAGYYFGADLQKNLDIPIGLVNTSWGGTCIEAWTPMEKQIADPAVKGMKNNYDKKAETYDEAKEKADHKEKMEEWKTKTAEWKEAGKKGRAPRKPRFNVHPHKNPNYPSNLYNGMIASILPFAIKGAIWYQGESNAGRAKNYRTQMERMILSWREVWKCGDFPFYFVQLPNYRKPWKKPIEDGGWPIVREAFMNTGKEVPNTGMAITMDIGEENDIHPKNKKDVGNRLARLALYNVYGKKDIVWTGPIYKSCEFKGPKAIVKFENGGSPLAVKGDKLDGFAMIDEMGKVAKADAKITSEDTVEVTSPEIKKAAMVYYAWAMNPVGSNLINKEGLPASPFRAGKIPEVNFLKRFLPEEASKYKLVYSFDPTNVKLADGNTKIVYDVDNSAKIKGFKKVVYFLALQDGSGNAKYALVSMDPYTDDVKKIGVPVKSTGAMFQQMIKNMTVKSNVDGVKNGEFPEGGNIEFWPCNYGATNQKKIPGASDKLYDFGDQTSSQSPGYGSMQIHNWKEKHSVICFNRFSGGSGCDVGIGNWDGKSRDWTFSGSAKKYTRGELKVLVLE